MRAHRLNERADRDPREDRLVVGDGVHLLFVQLPDRRRKVMVVVQPSDACSARWEKKNIFDRLAFEAVDLLAYLR